MQPSSEIGMEPIVSPDIPESSGADQVDAEFSATQENINNPESSGSEQVDADLSATKPQVLLLGNSRKSIVVALLSASGVKEIGESCDAYVKVIYGGKTEKSSVAQNTLDPVWNQLFCFERTSTYSSRFQRIELKVYDHNDVTDNTPLGSVILEWRYVARGGMFSVPIVNHRDPSQSCGTLSVKIMHAEILLEDFQQGFQIPPESLEEVQNFGGATDVIKDFKRKGALPSVEAILSGNKDIVSSENELKLLKKSKQNVVLALYSASGLQTSENHGTCDAFVRVLLGDEEFAKSNVVANTENPVWDQLLTFELPPGYSLRYSGLELQVKNHNDVRADGVVGKVLLEWHHVALGGIFGVSLVNETEPGKSFGTLFFQLLNARIVYDEFQQGMNILPDDYPLLGEIEYFSRSSGWDFVNNLKAERSYPLAKASDILQRSDGHFAVVLISATDLPKVNRIGTCTSLRSVAGSCDAYVKFMVGDRVAAQSEYVVSSLRPVWNHLFSIDITTEDLSRYPGMTIEVYDYNDFVADQYLGKILVEWSHMFLGGTFNVPILGGSGPDSLDGKIAGSLQFQIFNAHVILRGFKQGIALRSEEHEAMRKFAEASENEEITDLSVTRKEPEDPFQGSDWFEPSDSHVLVAVFSASNLKRMDYLGLSDPYLRIFVGQENQDTDIQYTTLHPVWNQLFCFPVDATALQSENPIKFECFDYDLGKKDDFLGDSVLRWSDVDGTEKTLNLYTSGESKGSIQILAAKCLATSPAFEQGMRIHKVLFLEHLQKALLKGQGQSSEEVTVNEINVDLTQEV